MKRDLETQLEELEKAASAFKSKIGQITDLHEGLIETNNKNGIELQLIKEFCEGELEDKERETPLDEMQAFPVSRIKAEGYRVAMQNILNFFFKEE